MEYKDLALFIVRLILGSTFIMHGFPKFKSLISGKKAAKDYLDDMGKLGVHPYLSVLVAFYEFIGGILVTLGFAAEFGALLIIPVMAGAIVLVHFKNGYFSHKGGYEYALNLLLLAVVVIIGGPGLYAIWDPFIFWR